METFPLKPDQQIEVEYLEPAGIPSQILDTLDVQNRTQGGKDEEKIHH